MIFVHWRRLRHDNGAFVVGTTSFAVSQLVLKAAGPTHHQPETSHRHVDLHLLGGIVPLIGANDVDEDWRLHLSIDEGVSVSVFSILLPELVRELHQLAEVAAEVDDGVFYSLLCVVYLSLKFRLLLDNKWILISLLLIAELEIVDHALKIDHGLDEVDEVELVASYE